MTVTKHYCDHCGKEVRNGDALRPVELHPFHWGATTVRHVCATCLHEIDDFIGSKRKHGEGGERDRLRSALRTIRETIEIQGRFDSAGGLHLDNVPASIIAKILLDASKEADDGK